MKAFLFKSIILTILFVSGCAGPKLLTQSRIPGDVNLGADWEEVSGIFDIQGAITDTLRTPGILGGIMGVWTICLCIDNIVEWAEFETDYRYSDSLERLLVNEYGSSSYHRPPLTILGAYRAWDKAGYFVRFRGSQDVNFDVRYFKNTGSPSPDN